MSSTNVFEPRPPSVPLTEAFVTVMMGIGTMAVFTRVAVRRSQSGLTFSDYLCFVGLIFAHATAISYLLIIRKIDESIVTRQFLFACILLHATGVLFLQISVLTFYRSIFARHVTVCVTTFCFCQPLSYFWLRHTDGTATGTCVDLPKFFLGIGIIIMFTYVGILIVPIPVLIRLQISLKEKIAMIGFLLLGGLVCIVYIIRIFEFRDFININDFIFWFCSELYVGVVSACLPTYATLFRQLWSYLNLRKILGTRYFTSNTSNSEVSGGSGEENLGI